MVAAVNVEVDVLASGTANEIAAGNLQSVLGAIYGKAIYAADTVGTAKGTADWAAQKLGAVHYHLQQIGTQVGYTVPPLDQM